MLEKFTRNQKVMTWILLAVYLLVMTWIILFKMSTSFQELPNLRNINLIPFNGSVIANNQIDLTEIRDNILIFIPFGVYLSMLKPNWSFYKKVVPIAATSLLFELLQFTFAIGATDITDFIGNTSGGIVGIGIYLALCRILKTKTNKILNILASIGTFCVVALLILLIVANQ